MASFEVDSELMNTWVAAVPVPTTRDFKVLKDGHSRPMILSLGNDGILYLIASDGDAQSGTHRSIDLTTSLGLDKAKDKISCFDAVQSLSSGKVYVSVAVESPGNWHRLLLLRSFDPSAIDIFTLDFSSLIIPQNVDIDPTKKIYMGNPDTDKASYPALVLSYEPQDRLKSEGIVSLILSNDLGSWTLNKDLKLSENADKILDLCSGTLGGDKGIFTLYTIQDQTSIKFTALMRLRQTSLNCPAGATRIASVFKSNGETDLVVGGRNLVYYTSTDMGFKNAQSTTISDDPLFNNIQDLEVSVGATGLDTPISIFTMSSSKAVSYISTTLKSITRDRIHPVPLLPEGQGGYFSSFLAENGNQSLIVASVDGSVTLLEQAADTGLWKRSPFNIKSLDENIELTCYQTKVTVSGADDEPIAGGRATVKSDGSVVATVNGLTVALTPEGIPLTLDASGSLTIVCPTGDISAYTYNISNVRTSDKTKVSGTAHVDPAGKIHQRMAALVQSPESLKTAKNSKGESLLSDAGSISDDDLKAACGSMTQLIEARSNLANGGQTVTAAANVITAATFAPRAGGDSWLDRAEKFAWDAWFWVERQFNKIKNWVVRVVDGIHEFLVEIGGKVMKFVLDTVTNISKALSWVWNNVIKVGWKKLVDFVGFLFSWDDIIETKNATYDFVNSALTSCANKIDGVAGSVDTWFLKIEDQLRKATMPPELASTSLSNKKGQGKAAGDANSAKVGWANYQVGHGGAAKNSTVIPDKDMGDTGDELTALFHKYVDILTDSLETTAKNVGNKLVLLFNNNRSVSTGTILQALGSDVLIGIIDLIRAFVVDLIRLGADIIRGLRKLLTCRIKMPIFTKLYESISGRECNVLDIISLILAIPITLLSKIVTGNKPPLLPKVSTETYTDMVDGGKNTDAASQLKYKQMSSSIALSSFSLQTVCDMIEIAGSLVPVGAGIAGAVAGKSSPIAVDYKLVFGIIGRAAGFPDIDKPIPGIEVALAIWGMSTVATFVRAAIRKIESSNPAAGSSDAALAKFLAGIEIALAAVSTGLWAANAALEYTAAPGEYPGWQQDRDDTSFKLAGAVLTQLGTISTAVAIIDPEPLTKGIGGAVSGISSGIAYGLLATRHYRALGNGKYANAVSKI